MDAHQGGWVDGEGRGSAAGAPALCLPPCTPAIPLPLPPCHRQALYRLSESSRAAIPGITEDMCATTWTPRGLHWHDAQEASPEDAPQALRQCSVSYQ